MRRARQHHETDHFLVRSDLAVRLPGLRTPAAGAGWLHLRRRVPARAVRRPAATLGAEGAGRDRAQARLDLPSRRLARPPARRRVADAGGAPVQPAAAAAPVRRRRAEPARRRSGDAPCLAWRRGCGRCGAHRRAGARTLASARSVSGRSQGRAARDHRPSHRARHLRRADVRVRWPPVLGPRSAADAACVAVGRCVVQRSGLGPGRPQALSGTAELRPAPGRSQASA